MGPTATFACQQIKAEVVEQMNTRADERANVDGDRPLRVVASGHHVGHAVAAENGRVLVVQPRRALGVESRQAVDVGVPRAEGVAPAVTAGVDEHDVTLFDLDADGVELVAGDGFAGLEPVDSAEPWDVEQHPASHDAAFGNLDRAAAGTDAGDLGGGRAVVHPPVDEHVAEGMWLTLLP